MAIKPCPFCGGKASQSVVNNSYRTGCSDCEIYHINSRPDHGKNIWNGREQENRLKFLEERNTELKNHITLLYQKVSLVAVEIAHEYMKETKDD
jgi:hypothetical protein